MTDIRDSNRRLPDHPACDPSSSQYFMCDILYVVDDSGAYICSRDWVEVEP
jgi:hypothetical protein